MAERPSDLPAAHVEQLDALASWYWWHVHRVRLALQLFDRFGRGSREGYLDVGCGPGSTTRLIGEGLRAHGLLSGEVSGVDGDARAGQASRRHGVHFYEADLQSSVLKVPEIFGWFTILDVLEHLDRPDVLLRALSPQLERGAIGVVTVPAFQGLFSDWDRSFGHKRRYSRVQLSELLSTAGYEVLWCGYAFSYAFLPAFAQRKLLGSGGAAVEFPKIPGWLNAALRTLGWCERLWLRAGKAPLGTSVVAAVRKR